MPKPATKKKRVQKEQREIQETHSSTSESSSDADILERWDSWMDDYCDM